MRRLRAASPVTAAVAAAVLRPPAAAAADAAAAATTPPKTLTYWATNQGASLEADKQILTPELEKFEKQTGIKVKLEVVPWSDLLNRILAATTSGQGPDVLNIGNTWSASLQATGALLPLDDKNFDTIGGKDRFVAVRARLAPAPPGKDPAAVPLYSLAYAPLLQQEDVRGRRHHQARRPPGTSWSPTARSSPRTASGAWPSRAPTRREHPPRLRLRPSSTARDFFDAAGKPDLRPPRRGRGGQAVRRLDGRATRSSHPGNAEYAQNQSLQRLRHGQGRDAAVAGRRPPRSRRTGMKPGRRGASPRCPCQSGAPGRRPAGQHAWSPASTWPSSRTPRTSTAR